jgi:Zn-dependent M16 (insulinase) family peptidase
LEATVAELRAERDAAKQATEKLEAEAVAKAAEATKATELNEIAKSLAGDTTAKQFVEGLQNEAKQAREDARKATERIAVIEADNQRRQFTETAKEFPGETALHVALMEKLAGDEASLAGYVQLQKAASEQLKASGMFRSFGASTSQANGEIDAVSSARKAAEVVAAATGKPVTARQLAEAWTPERYAQYIAETGN